MSATIAGLVLLWRLNWTELNWTELTGWHHTNDHGWLFQRSPRVIRGIYWEPGSFLKAFMNYYYFVGSSASWMHTIYHTEGIPCQGVATVLIIKPCPLAAQISCTFSPTSFSSVQIIQSLDSSTSLCFFSSLNGSVCCRDHGAEEPTKWNINNFSIMHRWPCAASEGALVVWVRSYRFLVS